VVDRPQRRQAELTYFSIRDARLSAGLFRSKGGGDTEEAVRRISCAAASRPGNGYVLYGVFG